MAPSSIAEICNLGECISRLGKGSTLTDAELGLLQQVKQFAERRVRRVVGCDIVQGTYTHVLPRYGERLRNRLLLPQYPVRSIATIHENPMAYAGAGDSPWEADSLLTEGTHWFLAIQRTGFSRYGAVYRLPHGRPWETRPGSVKVVYVAGWSADELDGEVTDPELDASDLKDAVIDAVVESYGLAMTRADMAEGGGPVASESLEGHSVSYAAAVIQDAVKQVFSGNIEMRLRAFSRPRIVA